MCRTLNPIHQLYKKCILRIVMETMFVYDSLNSANPYSFEHLYNGGSIPNYEADSKREIFYMRNRCLEASQ